MSHNSKDVDLMRNILTYIKDMVQHEPHLDSVTVLSRCKHEDGLRFGDLEKKIDRGKLVSYIDDLLSHHSDKTREELVTYTPSDKSSNMTHDSDNTIAEYYSHAEPHSS